MTRLRRIVLLVVSVAAVLGVSGLAAPAEARDPGPGGGCRFVGPDVDLESGTVNTRIIECYY